MCMCGLCTCMLDLLNFSQFCLIKLFSHFSNSINHINTVFAGDLMSQLASISQGRICSDSCKCCHTEIEVADQTCCLIQSHDNDTRPTSPSTDPTHFFFFGGRGEGG